MSTRNTVTRSMHDLGLAGWFGGSLMGAIGLNGAANVVKDKSDRTVVASAGWARWAPVNAVAIGIHAVGGIGLILANRGRVASQKGVAANTVIKSALTLAAIASTIYSGMQGKIVADAGAVSAEGGVIPVDETPKGVAAAQQQLRVAQWVTPAATAGLIILASQQGEQQRPVQVLKGSLQRN
ncbi:hypothetical protein EH165_14880 [Nakamurella antarctica]|uniref:Uncharacterized protein n=1 Tax=Nakamurella antarctica TaxID=1902245 RepID=A0A3G8ZPN5_9ACTN|nr:hypothetical protein [Nakamurella antarctica]AZI59233.1 hypothetical protein EH165_14880 [Nakamurella antarctica]